MAIIQHFKDVLPWTYCHQLVGGYSGFLDRAMVGEGARKGYSPGRIALSHEMEPSLQLNAYTIGLAKKLDGGIEGMKTTHVDMVCYGPGMKFTRHRDASKKEYTIIYFLNEGYEGGELRFDVGDVFKDMPAGDAVIWRNTPDSYHEVTEVTKGLRFVLAHWITL